MGALGSEFTKQSIFSFELKGVSFLFNGRIIKGLALPAASCEIAGAVISLIPPCWRSRNNHTATIFNSNKQQTISNSALLAFH
jgi:hypothetical protein